MEQNGKDFVEMWDSGNPFTTVEMGGLGPGYEQAIQIMTVEIVRDYLGKPLPTKDDEDQTEYENFGDATIRKHDDAVGGISGAMAGAAKFLAYRILRDGYAATIESMRKHDENRLIVVSRWFPQAAGA